MPFWGKLVRVVRLGYRAFSVRGVDSFGTASGPNVMSCGLSQCPEVVTVTVIYLIA
jgi:hypothetical protein